MDNDRAKEIKQIISNLNEVLSGNEFWQITVMIETLMYVIASVGRAIGNDEAARIQNIVMGLLEQLSTKEISVLDFIEKTTPEALLTENERLLILQSSGVSIFGNTSSPGQA